MAFPNDRAREGRARGRAFVRTSIFLGVLAASSIAYAWTVSSGRAADKIVFDPKVPLKLAKLFTVEHHLALQSLKMDDNGVEQIAQQALNLDTKQIVRTLDDYQACGGGRPTLLRRTYEDANIRVDVAFQSGNAGDKEAKDAIEAKSPFEGLVVLFTWAPEEKGYGKFYDAVEGDESYLPGLAEDLDLLALLPGHDVSPGDQWTIEPASIVDWVAPGGVLPMKFERKQGDRFVRTLNLGVGGGLTMVFGGDVKGKVSARYESRESKGEAGIAVLALDVDVETDRDQTRAGENMLSSDELLDGISVQHSEVRWKTKMQGKARWNLAANRIESLELAGSENVAYELSLGLRGGGKSVQNMSFSGGIHVACQTGAEARKPKDKSRAPDPSKPRAPALDGRSDVNGRPPESKDEKDGAKDAKDGPKKDGKDGR